MHPFDPNYKMPYSSWRKPFLFFHNSKDLNLAVLHENLWNGGEKEGFRFFPHSFSVDFFADVWALDAENHKNKMYDYKGSGYGKIREPMFENKSFTNQNIR